MGRPMKVTKGKNYDQSKRDNRCVACAGSGWYDDTRHGGPVKCGSCGGTGQEPTDPSPALGDGSSPSRSPKED